jgi:hypothetical protein
MSKYVVQRIDGYTDGRPSWRKVGWAYTKEAAVAEMVAQKRREPHASFRVRKKAGRSR